MKTQLSNTRRGFGLLLATSAAAMCCVASADTALVRLGYPQDDKDVRY